MVLIESLACGVPVVGADSGGPRDFMTKEVGYLVPESDDIEVFSERLAKPLLKQLKKTGKLRCLKIALKWPHLFLIP